MLQVTFLVQSRSILLLFSPAVGCVFFFIFRLLLAVHLFFTGPISHDLVVGLDRHVAGQEAILVRDLHVVRVVGRGKRHGTLHECMLTAVSSVRAPWTPRLGIHLTGSEVWVLKSRGPRGSGSPRVLCWECFFVRYTELNSKFDVTTISVILFDRPQIVTGFRPSVEMWLFTYYRLVRFFWIS